MAVASRLSRSERRRIEIETNRIIVVTTVLLVTHRKWTVDLQTVPFCVTSRKWLKLGISLHDDIKEPWCVTGLGTIKGHRGFGSKTSDHVGLILENTAAAVTRRQQWTGVKFLVFTHDTVRKQYQTRSSADADKPARRLRRFAFQIKFKKNKK